MLRQPIYRNIEVVLLSGGVGGARMAKGLARAMEPSLVTIIVNVGDDDTIYGALVCADIDTVTYNLAGIDSPQGWGIAGDTWTVMNHLADLGVDTTFRLGDRDLAMCLDRTASLAKGETLTAITHRHATALGVETTILPATNDPVRTKIQTAEGETLDFQQYFVTRRHLDQVVAVQFDGVHLAQPSEQVLGAIERSDAVLIAPSNPPLSIWPTLALPGVRSAIASKSVVMAVSPLMGGKAVKGPLVAVLEGLGLPPTNQGIVEAYDGLLTHLVFDTQDAHDANAVRAAGAEPIVGRTLITTPESAESLATDLLDRIARITPS